MKTIPKQQYTAKFKEQAVKHTHHGRDAMFLFYPHAGPRLERQVLLAGAAAGLFGAFNTPLAGIIFAIEEIARDFESRTNDTMITAVVFSGLTSLALAGNYLYFGQINVPQNFDIGFVFPVILTAILCGLLGLRSIGRCCTGRCGCQSRCRHGVRTSRWPTH